MQSFKSYANYYDLLYNDKDYAQEADFTSNLLKTHSPHPRHLIDLGCGTGRHASRLSDMGFLITGVDKSKEMIGLAEENIKHNSEPPELVLGDITTCRLGKTVDAAIALFHVMSYQTSYMDFLNVLETVKANVNKDGVFIFDIWFGPAVLWEKPSLRLKRMENENLEIFRTAEPVHRPMKNLVDVNYTLWIRDKQEDKTHCIRETHTLRYWFHPEIETMLDEKQMTILSCGEWLTKKKPGTDTWGVYYVVKT